MIINQIASIVDFLSINICLLQYFVLKEIVRQKLEDDLVAQWAWLPVCFFVIDVLDPNIDQMLKGNRIPLRDQLRETDVVPQSGEPELWDTG
jgi:hypothetical protein